MSDIILSDATVQSLIELGRQTAGPNNIQWDEKSPVPFIIHKGDVKQLPGLVFNDFADKPQRIKGTVNVLDAVSFVEYYTLFNNPDSRVFADETKQTVMGIIDYHTAGESTDVKEPRWCGHRVQLTLRKSEEWKRWEEDNSTEMSQKEFAEFLEQNAVDITSPVPASIREIAEDLEVTVDVDFASAQRMAGGKVNFRYTETTKTSVSGGKQITVPDQFVVSIAPFVGGAKTPIQVLLRYRIREQKLVFFYTIIRPEEAMRQAFIDSRDRIENDLKIVIINGAPAQ